MEKRQNDDGQQVQELQDFTLDAKKTIVEIINDCPTIVRLGEKDFLIKNLRFYSLMRICNLAIRMRDSEDIKDDQRVLTALCTDLDAMCEIIAVILCNHLFKAENEQTGYMELKSKNDKLVDMMKARVMESTFETGQWSAIVMAAIKSIDLSGFFLLKKSVSMLMDSLTKRKIKSEETVLQFMEAQSLQTQATS